MHTHSTTNEGKSHSKAKSPSSHFCGLRMGRREKGRGSAVDSYMYGEEERPSEYLPTLWTMSNCRTRNWERNRERGKKPKGNPIESNGFANGRNEVRKKQSKPSCECSQLRFFRPLISRFVTRLGLTFSLTMVHVRDRLLFYIFLRQLVGHGCRPKTIYNSMLATHLLLYLRTDCSRLRDSFEPFARLVFTHTKTH